MCPIDWLEEAELELIRFKVEGGGGGGGVGEGIAVDHASVSVSASGRLPENFFYTKNACPHSQSCLRDLVQDLTKEGIIKCEQNIRTQRPTG